MAIIEGFRVQNYRVLKDVSLGRLWNQQSNKPLTPLVAVIGKNGVGKSTLFDAFGFLADALRVGVEEACDLKQRGGFNRLRSFGTEEPIRFEVYYRESPNERPITYELSIAPDSKGRPYVEEERLRQRRKGQKQTGQPYSFLILRGGKGEAWAGEESFEGENAARVPVELTDSRKLGIATLGALKEHPRIAKFRSFLENWYLSYFTPDAARSLPMAGPHGRSLQYSDAAVIVVVDLDDKVCTAFKDDLVAILYSCNPKPRTLFRIAIEEMESWLLGDMNAVKKAYPNAKDKVLESYVQDSICGAWEKLADAIYTGGSFELRNQGWPYIGQAKCIWAKRISSFVDVEKNVSKSFQVFREGIIRLANPPIIS